MEPSPPGICSSATYTFALSTGPRCDSSLVPLMVDIASTYGALLLGGLVAAGYVTPIWLVPFLCNFSKSKVVRRSHRTSFCVHQTLPIGCHPYKDNGAMFFDLTDHPKIHCFLPKVAFVWSVFGNIVSFGYSQDFFKGPRFKSYRICVFHVMGLFYPVFWG